MIIATAALPPPINKGQHHRRARIFRRGNGRAQHIETTDSKNFRPEPGKNAIATRLGGLRRYTAQPPYIQWSDLLAALTLNKIITVDFLRFIRRDKGHSNVMVDHELGQLLAVHEHDL